MPKQDKKENERLAYISCLDGKLDVVAQLERLGSTLRFGKVEKDLSHNIAPLNEAKTFLQGTDHSLVPDRVGGILQSDVTGPQVAAVS